MFAAGHARTTYSGGPQDLSLAHPGLTITYGRSELGVVISDAGSAAGDRIGRLRISPRQIPAPKLLLLVVGRGAS